MNYDFDLKKFGKRLSTLLKENNISQTELAKRIGVTEATISRYTSGSRSPYIEIAIEMSQFFNVSIEYLLGLTDEKEIDKWENDIDYNINIFWKKLFDLKQEKNLSKQQIEAIKVLMLANENFILKISN